MLNSIWQPLLRAGRRVLPASLTRHTGRRSMWSTTKGLLESHRSHQSLYHGQRTGTTQRVRTRFAGREVAKQVRMHSIQHFLFRLNMPIVAGAALRERDFVLLRFQPGVQKGVSQPVIFSSLDLKTLYRKRCQRSSTSITGSA